MTLDEELSASVGLVSLSVGMGRVVTIWVTSLEKNFSSLYSRVNIGEHLLCKGQTYRSKRLNLP